MNTEKTENQQLEILLGQYNLWKNIASYELNLGRSDSDVYRSALSSLADVESKVSEVISDPFEREIFSVYITHKFDLDTLMDAHLEGDWMRPVREMLNELVKSLSIFPLLSGSELLLWLYEEIKTGRELGKDVGTTLRDVRERCASARTFCNRSIESLSISDSDLEYFFEYKILFFMIHTWESHVFDLFRVVYTDITGGEEWIRSEMKR